MRIYHQLPLLICGCSREASDVELKETTRSAPTAV